MRQSQSSPPPSRSLGGASPTSPPTPPAGERGTLNVIFHGAFLFVDKEGTEEIQILVPDLEGEHVVRAGSWLAETDLQRGTYRLEGVEGPGTARLSKDHNLIFRCAKQVPAKPYARLHFPRPRRICSLRRTKADTTVFDNPGNLPSDWKGQMATMQVFTYNFRSDAHLLLSKVPDPAAQKEEAHQGGPDEAGHYWEPAFGDEDIINLHIISAHDHECDPRHCARSFTKLMELAGLQLTRLRPVQTGSIETSELPYGVVPEETEDLTLRMRRLARLGRMRRLGRDVNQLWTASDALGTDPEACENCGCDG